MMKEKPASSIYFIKMGNYYKIGFARNVKARFSAINTSCPFKCELVATIKLPSIYLGRDARIVERELHRYLKDKHIKGEWFLLSHEEFLSARDWVQCNLKKFAETTRRVRRMTAVMASSV